MKDIQVTLNNWSQLRKKSHQALSFAQFHCTILNITLKANNLTAWIIPVIATLNYSIEFE